MVDIVDIVDIVDNVDIVDVTWRTGGEELCQQDAGEAADENPVGVEPWQGHLRKGEWRHTARSAEVEPPWTWLKVR